MYEAYFGLNENPFNITPDPRFLYLSHQHREALDHILYGINQRKGFVMVTGGVGTGKTTLSRALLQSLDSSVDTALIFNPSISEVELLQNVLSEFHLPNLPPTATKRDYIETLNEFLLQNFSAGRNAVLIIDEAQNLSHRVLEELRLLSNLETDREKLLQIILLGQVELAEMVSLYSLRQLNQRITVRYHLSFLNLEETVAYINHRLAVAGSNSERLFTDGACRLVYKYSQGCPRMINVICDRAILVAYVCNQKVVNRGTVVEALRDLGKKKRWLFAKPWGFSRKKSEGVTL
ncbi:MAG TPA: AAA family ATPase [Syntrophales bacterium]|nr:AAA family ATPase [Syntrophales bacterium]HOL58499.1 AAA family ATPase [Syntrophales bacterium]HPO34893.1 AAA family ATPase [Syntrophales bacterium]